MRRKIRRMRNQQLLSLMLAIEKENVLNNKDTFRIKDYFVQEEADYRALKD